MRPASDIIAAHLNQRYRHALMAFFVRRIRDRNEAEDLTQEVFTRLAARSARPLENPDAYIFQMAANLLRDRSRRCDVRARFSHTLSLDPCADREVLDPSRVLLGREELRCVAKALEQLPLRTRSIFLLYRLENMTRSDIGGMYGMSVSGVQKHLEKAMLHLSRSFGEAE